MPPRTPTAAHPAGADEQLELGRRIRQIRTTEAKMTIEALASAAGVSISLISQIERGRAEPSLNSLRRIGAALGVPIARFFVGEDDPSDGESDAMGRRLVVRAHERKHLRIAESDITWELLVPDLHRKLEVLWGEVGPGAITPPLDREPSQHIGEEVLVILDGTLTCWYDGDEFELRAGDTIAFDPTLPHRVENRGSKPVRMMIALTPPSF
jgi:transcriptional regulator with XRE-family HTH domain